MKNIYEFKKGDEVTRVVPSKVLTSGLGGGTADRSYIGTKLIFVGIANGCAYFQRTDKTDRAIFGDDLIDLPLDIFDEGWDEYQEPTNLLEGIIPISSLKIALDNAIKREDYRLAEKLQKEIEKKGGNVE